ncbi:MAG: cyclic nucleotide-binding domain-containing protein [Anaerolineae bacterium]|nr:cyclic nucleotide-binding domain-containing protein [Anaerolineae bacterium]
MRPEDVNQHPSDGADGAFGWLKSGQVRPRQHNEAFSVTQLLDLPEEQRELMLELNRREPITLAELARALDRSPTELELQLNQLVAQNWLEVQEDDFGEWIYRVRMARHSKRILPPGIWQTLDDQWQIPIFRLFSEAALEEFSQRFKLEHHPEGAILFRAGEWSTRMYVVDSGRIELTVHNQAGDPFVVREITSGDVFGEMSIVIGEQRPYTAYVSEEARVWTLDKADLDYLLAQYPSAGLSIRRELARQHKTSHSMAETQMQHNPVVAVGDEGAKLAWRLARQVSGPVACIDLIGKQPEPLPNLTYIEGSGMRSKTIADTISEQIRRGAWVVIAAYPQMTDQLMRVIGLAEVVIDLTGNGAPWLRAASRRYWNMPASGDLHLSRLARKLTGQVTGLVLSSGVARTIAHLGVLQVLDGAGIEFDVIAGCGYGAYWGALYAAGWSIEQMIDLAVNKMARLQPFGGWLGLRPAARSGLFDAQSVRRLIRETIGVRTFADLKTPCQLVVSDLVTGDTIWIDRGNLFNVLSACVAIPGLVTPVELQDRLLVDAILTNPLPADAAATQDTDIVIASSVIPTSSMRQQKTLQDQKQDLVSSWFSVCDIVAHARSLDHVQVIDLLIAPQIADFADTAFEHAERLIERGRQAAEKALPQIKKLTSPE